MLHSVLLPANQMDYESFLSLCLEDLLEMGITDAGDRKELMAIITKCHTHPAVSGKPHPPLLLPW